MRAKKFRVWDKQKSAWNPNVKIDGYGDLYPEDDNANYDISVDCMQLVVQYFTGLRDKNENEIIEGDIINDRIWIDCSAMESTIIWNETPQKSISVPHVVRYDDSVGGYELHNSEYNKSTPFWAVGKRIKQLEVIGTVFENPELLTDQSSKQKFLKA